jgi:hypothetical protein
MLTRLAKAIAYIPWLEQLDIHIAEEDWVDLWLEGGGEEAVRSARRIQTPMPSFQRPNSFEARKAAAAKSQGWDEDFANAQSHVHSILGKLGNAK